MYIHIMYVHLDKVTFSLVANYILFVGFCNQKYYYYFCTFKTLLLYCVS